jgi:hypothetical protein
MEQAWKNHLGQTLVARVPANVLPYVGAVGMDGAARFLLAFGGGNLRPPKTKRGSSFRKIADVVGEEAAGRLVDAFGPVIERVPVAPSFIARHLKGEGKSIQQIARVLHRVDVTIREYLQPGGGNPPARLLQPGEVIE